MYFAGLTFIVDDIQTAEHAVLRHHSASARKDRAGLGYCRRTRDPARARCCTVRIDDWQESASRTNETGSRGVIE
jgi:hypothetical protein